MVTPPLTAVTVCAQGVQHIGGPADADKKVKLASGESEPSRTLPPLPPNLAEHLGPLADAFPPRCPPRGTGEYMHHDPDVAAVVVGFDRNVNYYKIQCV